MVMGYAGPVCMCGNTRYTPTYPTPAVNRDILFEHEQTKQALKKAEAEVARLRETLAFIANETSTHDSTEYYRRVAAGALNQ